MRRKGMVGLAVLASLAASLFGFAPEAKAGPLITCSMAGRASTADVGTDTVWTLTGVGTCAGDGKGPYASSLTGSGTSTGLDVCNNNLPVQDLALDIHLTLDAVGVPARHVELDQTWSAPITLYPIVTPFLINDLGGAGVISSRIFRVCAPAGKDVAQYEFTFLK